jgi:hypothetical protein
MPEVRCHPGSLFQSENLLAVPVSVGFGNSPRSPVLRLLRSTRHCCCKQARETKSYMNWIQIADAKQHTLYNCSPQEHICDLLGYDPADDLSAITFLPQKSQIVQNEKGSQSWEDLGTRSILGFDTVGVRETTITNAGVLGNDQPLTSLTEYWHSQQLGLNLLSMRSSPFFGKQTFTITELTAGEPDPNLFQIPAGYKVNDQRRKVGTGFNRNNLASLYHKFQPLKRKTPAAEDLPHGTFLSAELVGQISYTELTKDGRLRHPVYLGLRDDKDAKDVVLPEIDRLAGK